MIDLIKLFNEIEAKIPDDSGEKYYYLSSYEKEIIEHWERVKEYLQKKM